MYKENNYYGSPATKLPSDVAFEISHELVNLRNLINGTLDLTVFKNYTHTLEQKITQLNNLIQIMQEYAEKTQVHEKEHKNP